MPWYRVMVNGEHFFFDVDGEAKRMGFYSARFVEAPGNTEAEELAIAQIHEDRRFGAQLEEDDGLATLTVEEVSEVDETKVPEVRPGMTLYLEETDG
jgi:hypothetical protein